MLNKTWIKIYPLPSIICPVLCQSTTTNNIQQPIRGTNAFTYWSCDIITFCVYTHTDLAAMFVWIQFGLVVLITSVSAAWYACWGSLAFVFSGWDWRSLGLKGPSHEVPFFFILGRMLMGSRYFCTCCVFELRLIPSSHSKKEPCATLSWLGDR